MGEAEAWYCEVPGKSLVKGQPQLQWKPKVLSLDTMWQGWSPGRSQERPLVKGQPQLSWRTLFLSRWFGLYHLEVRENWRALLVEDTIPGNQAILI